MALLRKLGRAITWLLLGAVGLTAIAALALVLFVRTEGGRRRVLALALPEIQGMLNGTVSIGGLQGDLTRELVLRQLQWRDAEGQVAIRVARLQLRYHLWELLKHRLRVERVTAEGVVVEARSLKDGRLNLADLIKPVTPTQSAGAPLSIDFHSARVDAELRFSSRAEGPVEVHLDFDGSARMVGDEIAVQATMLELTSARPLSAHARLSGGLRLAEVTELKDVSLTVEATGVEVNRLYPALEFRGPWKAEVGASGPLAHAAVSVMVTPPKGTIEATGTFGLSLKGFTWSGALTARDIDPEAGRAGLPRGRIDFEGSGRGENARVDVTLSRLEGELLGAGVQASGVLRYDRALVASGSAAVSAREVSTVISQMAIPGLHGLSLSGAVDLKAHVDHTPKRTRLDADLDATRLDVAGQRFGRVEGHLHTQGLEGSLTASAVGLHETEVRVEARGERLPSEGPFAIDVRLDRVLVALLNERWASSRPGHLRYDHRGVAGRLELSSRRQTIAVEGFYGEGGRAIEAKVAARGVDVGRLAQLIYRGPSPGISFPSSAFDVEAQVRGSVRWPILDLTIRGVSEPVARFALGRVRYQASGHYEAERVRGELVLKSGDQALHGKFDLPVRLDEEGRVDGDLVLQGIPVEKLASQVWRRRETVTIKGLLEGKVRVSGTTRALKVEAEAALPRWELYGLSRNQSTATLRYGDERLDLRMVSAFGRDRRGDAGSIDVAVEAPIDLSEAFARGSRGGLRRLMERIEHTTRITGALTLKELDLARLPLVELGIKTPIDTGRLGGAIHLAGTLHDPSLDAKLEAKGLVLLGLDHLDVGFDATYGQRRGRIALTSSLRGAPLLSGTAQTTLDLQKVVDHLPFGNAPIRVDVLLPAYDLALWEGFGGVVSGEAHLEGTLSHPSGTGSLVAKGLRVSDMRFSRFDATGSYDATHATLRLAADPFTGGSLHLEVDRPADRSQPLFGRLSAQRIELDIGGAGVGMIRQLRGRLDGDVTLGGTRSRPLLRGSIGLTGGALTMANDARRYKDVALELQFQPGLVELRRLSAKVGVGGAQGSGRVLLDGLSPLRLETSLDFTHFPFQQGNVAVWLDSHAEVRGERKDGVLSGVVTVSNGSARLPPMTSGRALQSTKPLRDVLYTDAAARRQRDEEARELREHTAVKASIVTRIPGPFRVRSKELQTDLRGELAIELCGEVVRISGQVESTWGKIELLGRPYQIERVRATFDGKPENDPRLDVRVTRAIADATVVIELGGTANSPALNLSSDPPIYDRSQIIGLIVSGDPGSSRVSARTTDETVVGAVSGVLVNEIKNQIAPGLPIDVVKLDAADTSATGTGSTRLEVGKYLTDAIYLSYVHPFGAQTGVRPRNSNEANLEYRFKRNFEIATIYGDAGVGAVNFYWTLRY